MATESGARHRDNQNVFRITDVKKRKKLLGRVLKIPEFNEEDDLRPGILLDIHWDISQAAQVHVSRKSQR